MIVLDQNVYDKINTHFPKKKDSVTAKVNEYALQLSNQIFESKNRNHGVLRDKVFDVSLQKLRGDTRVRVNGKMIKLHDWLLDTCPLFRIESTGNLFTQQLSQITLTTNAIYEELLMSNLFTGTDYTDAEVLDSLRDKNFKQLFEMMYPEYNLYTQEQRDELYDYTPINISSIQGYINWISKEAHDMPLGKKNLITRQAQILIAIASVNDGLLPQLKIKSDFGRTYYRGLSVQNIKKELRQAALGGQNAVYDARSSAIAWKLSFAKYMYPDVKNAIDNFPITKMYCENKYDIFDCIHAELVLQFPDKTIYESFLKSAFTAITFGASATANYSYLDKSGKKVVTTFGNLIKDKAVREAFLNHDAVQLFVKEQTELENFIFDNVKDSDEIKNNPKLKSNTSNRLKKSKVISFLYQQQESKFMADIIQFIETMYGNNTVIAKIHDGIVTNRPLSSKVLDEINLTIQDLYQIELFDFSIAVKKKDKVRRYNQTQTEFEKAHTDKEIAEHKARMKELEKQAKSKVDSAGTVIKEGYKSVLNSPFVSEHEIKQKEEQAMFDAYESFMNQLDPLPVKNKFYKDSNNDSNNDSFDY